MVVTKVSAQSPGQKAAADAFNKRDWPKVAEAYAALVRSDTTNAQQYMRLAIALTALGKYDEAKQNLAMAQRRGVGAPAIAFHHAVIEAGANRLDSAFAHLKRATDAGLAAAPIPTDSLAPAQKLRSDARYAAFLTDLDRNRRPCMYDEKHREFDFWLGTWQVRPRTNPLAAGGTNVITRIDDGCVVHESWTSGPSQGQSFNIWDRTRQKWFQIWVDNTGGLHEYSGEYRDNAMRYEGEVPALPPAKGRAKARLTFFRIAPDTVRQFAEVQQADGSWVTAYDLIYTRKD